MIAIESTLVAKNERSETLFRSRAQEDGELEPRSSRVRVLVVDDQRLIADSLSEILENAGFESMAAYDGRDALEAMARFGPQWVLSDVVMPRMNGVELAIAIRTNYPMTEILLFSGQAGISEILQDAQRRGYEFELIGKPIHPSKLIDRLTKRSPS